MIQVCQTAGCTYFLARQRRPDPAIDFYITRARLALPAGDARTLIVYLKPDMWHKIDGETSQVTLMSLAQVLPRPATVRVGGQTVIVADYWRNGRVAAQSSSL